FPAYVKNVRRAALEQRVAHNIVLLKATSELQTSDKLVRIGEQAQALLDVLSENNTSSIRTTSSIPDIFSVEVPDVDYIAPDLFPRGNVVLVKGNPGCGKSFVALKLAVSIAMGTEFLGRSCERLPVLIVVKENPIQLQRQRLRILANGPVLLLNIWGGWLPDPPPRLGDPRLLRIAKEEKPVIILDSLVRFHDADENDASEMRTVMPHVRRLADAGATIIVLHHKPKSDESLYRGSSDILAASGSVPANVVFSPIYPEVP